MSLTPDQLAARLASHKASGDVYEMARRACQDYVDPQDRARRGIPAAAEKMGVPAGTLWNKLHWSEDAHHKLTVQDVIQITVISGDLRPLQALNYTLNCVCFPVPDLRNVSDEALLEHLLKIHEAGGVWHAALKRALGDQRFEPGEFATLHALALTWVGTIVETQHRLQGLVDV